MANSTQEVLIVDEVAQVEIHVEWARKVRKTTLTVSRSLSENHSGIEVDPRKWIQEVPTVELGHAEKRVVWVDKVRTTHRHTESRSPMLVEVCMIILGLRRKLEVVATRVRLRDT